LSRLNGKEGAARSSRAPRNEVVGLLRWAKMSRIAAGNMQQEREKTLALICIAASFTISWEYEMGLWGLLTG
jgi:hypothetical protein